MSGPIFKQTLGVYEKARSAMNVGALGMAVYIVENRIGIRLPLKSETRWRLATKFEVNFWNRWFETKGLGYQEESRSEYELRLDPNLALEERLVNLLPKNKDTVEILDVGSGPLTSLGKKHDGIKIKITAIDPLADEYDKLIDKYHITPPVRTIRVDAEKITTVFPENSFDFVYARNSIDHSYSPEKAILEMIKVARKGCYVLMSHRPNEAVMNNYTGFHQWNFSMEKGNLIISSKNESTNFSQKYKDLCSMTYTQSEDSIGKWDNILILKKDNDGPLKNQEISSKEGELK